MSYYSEPDSHIKNKIKLELDLSNFAIKKELKHAAGVALSYLAAKRDFIFLKIKFNKLDINKLFNLSTSLNNSKTKVHDLDAGKLKIVPVDQKKLSDVVDNQVVKNTKFTTLKRKVNKLDKQFLMQLI